MGFKGKGLKEILRNLGPEKPDPNIIFRLEEVEERVEVIDDVLGIDSAALVAAEVELERLKGGE